MDLVEVVSDQDHLTLFITTQEGMQGPGSNVSTTPLRQCGFRQCLPFSWTTPRGKHCRFPIAVMGVVVTFKPCLVEKCALLNLIRERT